MGNASVWYGIERKVPTAWALGVLGNSSLRLRALECRTGSAPRQPGGERDGRENKGRKTLKGVPGLPALIFYETIGPK